MVFLIPPFILLLKYNSLLLSLFSAFIVFTGVFRLARYNVETPIKGKVKGLIASQPAHYLYMAVLLNANIFILMVISLVSSILMTVNFYTPEKYTNWASKTMILTNLVLAMSLLI